MFAVSDGALLWHCGTMDDGPKEVRLRGRLVNGLYTEAMLLADEARSYFDRQGREDRETLDPVARVALSCESLKITTRLMHVLAWLLTERAIELGQMNEEEAAASARRLGDAASSDASAIEGLPRPAIALIDASQDLYARVRRLETESPESALGVSPALSLLDRLERAF
jgi:regulator of CtrA degradation